MKHCETCRHWEQKAGPWAGYELDGRGGFCNSPKFSEDSNYAEDALVYSYQEGGSFWTGPKFGCVNHEDKT